MAVTVRVGLLRRLLLVRLLVVGLAGIAAIGWLLVVTHLSTIKSLSDSPGTFSIEPRDKQAYGYCCCGGYDGCCGGYPGAPE